MSKLVTIVLVCAAIQLWSEQTRAQDACEFKQIDTLGAQGAGVSDLNNWAQVVGSLRYVDPSTLERPFIWHKGHTQVLPALEEGASAGAMAINDVGRIVGWSDSSEGTVPTTWFRDEIMALQSPVAGYATDINNRGQVTGFTQSGECLFWPDVNSPPITLPGGGGSCDPHAIGDQGAVVGALSSIPREPHAFIWTGDEVRDVNPSEAVFGSSLRSINSLGLAAGVAHLNDGPHVLVLWRGRTRVLPLIGSGQAVNVWGSIAVVDFREQAAASYLRLSNRFGIARDMGTLGGQVFTGDLFMNDRFQIAWNPHPVNGSGLEAAPQFCQLKR
jgi:uncharacterized membrane protein